MHTGMFQAQFRMSRDCRRAFINAGGCLAYLYANDTAPATAVLALIYCLIAAAQSIKAQDSSHTVPNEANLES